MRMVRQAYMQSLTKSISRARAKLQMPQTNGHRILCKSLRQKPCELQAVQKVITHDKQVRPQFLAHVHTNFWTQYLIPEAVLS
jgi:hypothetical protein